MAKVAKGERVLTVRTQGHDQLDSPHRAGRKRTTRHSNSRRGLRERGTDVSGSVVRSFNRPGPRAPTDYLDTQ